jgi:hypothetical protein
MVKKNRHVSPENVKALQKQLQQHRMLLELGRVIVSEMDMQVLFKVIMDQTRRFMDTEKCSVFIFDEKKMSCGPEFQQILKPMRSVFQPIGELPDGSFRIKNP